MKRGRYFERQPERKKERSKSTEPLFRADTLISKLQANPDLFTPPTFKQRLAIRFAKPELRMQYILQNCTIQEIHVVPPANREVRTAERLVEAARANLVQHFTPEELQNPVVATNIQKVLDQLEFLARWLQTPAIFDYRTDHDERRVWERKISDIFDNQQSSESNGPFEQFYSKNKISSNYCARIFGNAVVTRILNDLGLEHVAGKQELQKIESLSKKYAQIESSDVSARLEFIQKKLKPFVFAMLTKFARRPYKRIGEPITIPPQMEEDTISQPVSVSTEFGQEPDWLQQQLEEDEERFDWNQFLGE